MKFDAFLILVLVSGLLAAPVEASGPVEMPVAVYVDPDNPQRLIVRYDNTGSRTGFLYSEDAGETFSLVCSTSISAAVLRALGSPPKSVRDDVYSGLSRMRRALVTGGGRTLIATSSGLFIDNGTGCEFREVPELSGLYVSGIASALGSPQVSYLITDGSTDSAGEGLWKRDASGALTKLSPRSVPPDTDIRVVSGLIAHSLSSGGTRLLTLSTRYSMAGGGFRSYVMRSDNGGTEWDEFLVENVPERATFTLLAVDPTDGNRVLAMFQRAKEGGDWEANKDTLLISQNGGETFAPYFDATNVTSAMFDPDGTLWISDLGSENGEPGPQGLFKSAPGLATAPEHVIEDQSISCLARAPNGTDLYLCHRTDFGILDPATGVFTELTNMTSVETIRSCSGQDLVADCRDQLCDPGWCGPGHFAKAPMCSAYMERYCGNDADNWNNTGADAGSDVGDAGLNEEDGGPSVDSGLGEEPHGDVVTRRPKGGCSISPAQSWRLSEAILVAVLAAATRRVSRRKTRA